MNYFKLAECTPEVLQAIKTAEEESRFHDHLDPIDYENCYPVTESFPYIPKGRLARKQRRQRLFPVAPFCFAVNHFTLKTKVYGRENLKGIDNAVVTCNHVNKLDAIAVRHAVLKKGFFCRICGKRTGKGPARFKVMVADFNNQKGKLGDYMRAFGILPFASNIGAVRSFSRAVREYLSSGSYILFFPEEAEWWCYEKPRPLKEGAFYYAVKNHVPVVPVFITFSKRRRSRLPRFHVHILKPVFARADLTDRENIVWMKEENYQRWVEKYEDFYGKQIKTY